MTVDGTPARNGSTVVLNCSATGLQSVSYEWERRISSDANMLFGSGVSSGSGGSGVLAGYDFVSGNQTLEFNPIVFGHEGVYRCVATNGSGEEYLSEDITLSSG